MKFILKAIKSLFVADYPTWAEIIENCHNRNWVRQQVRRNYLTEDKDEATRMDVLTTFLILHGECNQQGIQWLRVRLTEVSPEEVPGLLQALFNLGRTLNHV